ncbi:hypothetical protein, partial [Plasmodium yoelii yoelii]
VKNTTNNLNKKSHHIPNILINSILF